MIIKSKVIAFSIATLLAELAEIKEQNEQLQSTVATLQLEKSILSTSIEVRQVQEPTLLGVSIHNNGWLQNVSGLVAQEVAAELEGFDGVGSQVETKKLSVILKVVNSRLEELFGFPFSAINVVQLFPKKQTAIPLHRELFGSFPNNLFSTDQEEKIGSTYLKAIEMLSQDPSQVIVLPTPDLLITASKILKISTSELEGRLAQSDDHIEGLPGPLYKALKEGSRANLRILLTVFQ